MHMNSTKPTEQNMESSSYPRSNTVILKTFEFISGIVMACVLTVMMFCSIFLVFLMFNTLPDFATSALPPNYDNMEGKK